LQGKKAIQAYPDGVVRIYAVGNVAQPGKMPVEGLTLTETLPFAQKTVGAMRFAQGVLVGYRIDNRLRTPRRDSVTTMHVARTHDGTRYHIRQVQYPEDVTPPSMDLALERMAADDA